MELSQKKPETTGTNLGNAPARRVTAENRVPMSLPNTKLAIPHMDGFYLYWHLGKDVPAARKAGYQHVEDHELDVEQKNVANSAADSGSTDMGSNISVSAGRGLGEDLQAERLYLMKLPQEFRDADLAAQGKVNESIAVALRAGSLGADKDPDRNKRYMKAGQDLFYPKTPRP